MCVKRIASLLVQYGTNCTTVLYLLVSILVNLREDYEFSLCGKILDSQEECVNPRTIVDDGALILVLLVRKKCLWTR